MLSLLSAVYCLSPDNPLLLRWLKFSFASFISRYRSILVCHQAAEVGAIAFFRSRFARPLLVDGRLPSRLFPFVWRLPLLSFPRLWHFALERATGEG